MLYAYDKDKETLVLCKETNFKSQLVTERFHIEEWVKADPSVLGEELMVITSEFAGFDQTKERLDVLALDTSGQLVVVELKRDDSGKNVDLQALKYAAYCSTMTLEQVAKIHAEYRTANGVQMTAEGAEVVIREFITDVEFSEISDTPRIMLVAREYRSEVTACVKWLRDKHGVDITCIKWDVYELPNKSVVVDTSVLIPQPETREFEMRVRNKEKTERPLSRRQIATNEFFVHCAELLNEQIPMDYVAPNDLPYYVIPTGAPDVHFEWGFYGRPRTLGVEVHFEKSTTDQNVAAFAVCEPHLPALEAALGEPVSVESPWHSHWLRFYIERQNAEMDEELATWAADKMAVFMQVMKPVLDGMLVE